MPTQPITARELFDDLKNRNEVIPTKIGLSYWDYRLLEESGEDMTRYEVFQFAGQDLQTK